MTDDIYHLDAGNRSDDHHQAVEASQHALETDDLATPTHCSMKHGWRSSAPSTTQEQCEVAYDCYE